MKYLNGVLTVIAVCLVLITFAVTGLIQSASAKQPNSRFVSVPVNPDGSVTVRLAKGETMDVNVVEVNGSSISGSDIPVTAKSAMDVNIEEVHGHSVNFTPLPVSIQR